MGYHFDGEGERSRHENLLQMQEEKRRSPVLPLETFLVQGVQEGLGQIQDQGTGCAAKQGEN